MVGTYHYAGCTMTSMFTFYFLHYCNHNSQATLSQKLNKSAPTLIYPSSHAFEPLYVKPFTAFSTFRSLFWITKQPADKVDFITDVDATLKLLEEAGTSKDSRYIAQLSSAYLNPTESLLSVLRNGFQRIELLTAGKISHGFKPKKKEGSHECHS